VGLKFVGDLKFVGGLCASSGRGKLLWALQTFFWVNR